MGWAASWAGDSSHNLFHKPPFPEDKLLATEAIVPFFRVRMNSIEIVPDKLLKILYWCSGSIGLPMVPAFYNPLEYVVVSREQKQHNEKNGAFRQHLSKDNVLIFFPPVAGLVRLQNR